MVGFTLFPHDALNNIKIQQSLKSAESGVNQDIASLTYDCIGTTKVKATLGLFMCIAFLVRACDHLIMQVG